MTSFLDNTISHIGALGRYICDGGCKKQFVSLCRRAADGEAKASSTLINGTLKTIGAAVVAGIIAGFTGGGIILVSSAAILMGAHEVYQTDSGRQTLGAVCNLRDSVVSGLKTIGNSAVGQLNKVGTFLENGFYQLKAQIIN